MEFVNKWLSGQFETNEYEVWIKEIDSSHPNLEVAECALSLGIEELCNIARENLTESELLILELISMRNSGEMDKMFNNIDKALLLVREKGSRDLILEGRLRMELGLIKVQTNSKDDPREDFEWALKRLSSVCEHSRLHGLSIINKAAFHEHVDEKLMALHLYGEIPLNGKFPKEVVGFSRIGAARIMMEIGHVSDSCRHLYNAHKIFKKSKNEELAWHSGFQFLTTAAPHIKINAKRMLEQSKDASPREIGEEIPTPGINPLDLKEIATNLKDSESIYRNVDEEIKKFVDEIIENTEFFST
ncbi:MAG: hypothetical protein VYE59_05255 [Candidatus Thermoplasmatota archaeon]|nr:hypothetical protein [Candidatus Thermoplasmatota archaeon]